MNILLFLVSLYKGARASRGGIIIMERSFETTILKLQHPFSMILAGGRRTGKTQFTKKLLLQKDWIINVPIERIIWFHSTAQPDVFVELKHTVNIDFVEGLPKTNMDTFLMDKPGSKLLVFDDMMEEASERVDIKHLFTRGRHQDTSVMFLTQNLYHQSKHSREMSLNTDYMVLFKNPRDSMIITTLGKQMGNVKFLKDAYEQATAKPFSYLFVDLRSDTPEDLRYRSDVLDDDMQVVFKSS